jgi:hypothetical protein
MFVFAPALGGAGAALAQALKHRAWRWAGAISAAPSTDDCLAPIFSLNRIKDRYPFIRNMQPSYADIQPLIWRHRSDYNAEKTLEVKESAEYRQRMPSPLLRLS